VIQFGEDVPNNILYPAAHRQFVFSIPILLRVTFKYDRKLLTKFCHCAKESLEIFFRTVLGLDDGILGMILVIHTFGDYARSTPICMPSLLTACSDRTGPFTVFRTEDHLPRGHRQGHLSLGHDPWKEQVRLGGLKSSPLKNSSPPSLSIFRIPPRRIRW
jgi:hypothetical protein